MKKLPKVHYHLGDYIKIANSTVGSLAFTNILFS